MTCGRGFTSTVFHRSHHRPELYPHRRAKGLLRFEQNQLVITIRHDGMYLNQQKVANQQELANLIGAQMSSRAPADKVVFINSEDQIPFDASVTAMDAAHQGGAVKIGFLTDPPK